VFRKLLQSILVLSAVVTACAQSASSGYDPRITFSPLMLPDPVNSYRSGNGAPGPDYWQNRADYEIHANLDPEKKILSASETIVYTNNSPDKLTSLWVQMEQNTYRKDSRAGAVSGRLRKEFTEGFILDSVELESGKLINKAEYLIDDTRMQVRLEAPLMPKCQLKLHIKYHYQIPGKFGGRNSWGMSQKGEIYDMAQWYPRMAVYDDLRGWDTLPYLGSEFYLEYGHFDYYVTVPSSFLIAGSGELMNPQEVLTKTQIERLNQARSSDATVYIRKPEEVFDPSSRPKKDGTLTWHFAMDHTRDVAFSASPVFVWDAARINLPDGKKSLAMSVYPPESVGEDAWTKSTEYIKDTVEHFSQHWFPYPWPAAINVAGFSTGMEYPGIVFDGIPDKGSFLFWVTAHEIGHDWFPMIVGSNERRNAWMDEGFNTFIDIEESDLYAHGKYGPKRDSEYSAGGEPADMILKVLENKDAPNVLFRADGYPRELGHPVSYFKGAYGMVLLREQILGPQRFDWAFRKYIRDWAYKHPSPSDFFREMESEAGEDLGWFWRGWYFNNWTLDFAVQGAKYVNNDPKQGAEITLQSKSQLILPVTVEVKFADGSSTRTKLPAETWLAKCSHTMVLDSTQPIVSITIDPDHEIPDSDRSNNVFKM
jgi:hypothetical protein